MAYTKTNWVNGYTPLNASNMNKIEEGIYSNDTFLSSLDIRVNTLEGSIGQGGIGSVVVNGNGNALNNVSYNPSTKILNFEKNNTFALDSDSKKSLYHLGAYDSVSGNVITRQTGYIKLNGSESGWDSYNAGFWAYITINDITPTSSQTELGQFVVSKGNVVTTRTMINTSSGIQISLDNTNLNIRPNVSDVNTTDTFKTWLSQNPIVIQYKLATPYTETIIEDRPLTTLDQSGSQWVREEWEKGLNLCESSQQGYIRSEDGSIGASNNSYVSNKIRVYANKTYTYYGYSYGTYALDGTWQSLAVYRSSDQVESFTPTADCLVVLQSKSNNIMLVSGSHFYHYQQYQGGIVREKQLNDQIVKVKIFSGDTSTFNDFTSWVQANNERIISIMYYENASGGHNYYNVIFGSDNSVFKFINNEETLESIRTLSSGSEGTDILKIYYI